MGDIYHACSFMIFFLILIMYNIWVQTYNYTNIFFSDKNNKIFNFYKICHFVLARKKIGTYLIKKKVEKLSLYIFYSILNIFIW